MADSAIDPHVLLPWHLNGTLEPEERVLFDRHLAACLECRREAEVLGSLRDAVQRHGEDFFAPHPAAADIVGFAEGLLDERGAGVVRRHLELCATCLVEDGIVRRGGLPALPAPSSGVRRGAWRAAAAGAAAAFLVTAAIVLLVERPERGAPPTGPVAAFYVPLPERDAAVTEIRVPRGAATFQIVLPIDPAGGVPVLSVLVEDRVGRRVFERDGVSEIYRDAFLFLLCARADFPDGDYRVRLTPPATPGSPAPPALEFHFRVRGG